MFGPNGSADAFGTWLIVMFLGAAVCAGGGLLAYSGRWRRWYRPIESPMRYAPLAAVPFGVGCLIEFGATLFPLDNAAQQAVVVALFVCLLLSLLLFLKFPDGCGRGGSSSSMEKPWIKCGRPARGGRPPADGT